MRPLTPGAKRRVWIPLDERSSVLVLQADPKDIPGWLLEIQERMDAKQLDDPPTYACNVCQDIALVPVGVRFMGHRRYDTYGPCVECEAGLRIAQRMVAEQEKRSQRREERKRARPRNRKLAGKDAAAGEHDDEEPPL